MEQSLGELLRRFFGATDHLARTGLDREQTLSLSLRDAAEGCRRRVSAQRRVRCGDCAASGESGPGRVETCRACSGNGRVTLQSAGQALSMGCEHCNGRGEIVSRRCGSCGGSGLKLVQETLDARVPPGVKSGQTLRLRGKGDQSLGAEGRDGDLLLRVDVIEHELLKRDGDDIIVHVSIDADVATLGGVVQVPGLHGSERVAVSPGTIDGSEICVAGHGALRLGSQPMPPPLGEATAGPYRGAEEAGDHRGNLIVRIYVEPRTPRKGTRIAIAAVLAAAAATALALLM